MDALIIALINKLAAWLVGKSFFANVLAVVSTLDGRMDLDGDGKKDAAWTELKNAGILFGTKQFNLAIELAVQYLQRVPK